LVEFESALDATQCAVEIQEFLQEYNISSSDDWKIKLRIGIHLGDVIHKSNDVFGDAVNIASRIQPLADPEGICISAQVFDQIQNKIEYHLKRLERPGLKNVKYGTQVYKLVLPWETSKRKEAPRRKTPSLVKRRITVLPFENISPNPNDAYFSDGMTEELISTISKISGLQVIARTSVIRYKGSKKGIDEIGRELRSGTVLEGSVRMAGDRLRVTAQLVEAQSNRHIWSDSYDRKLGDVFDIQSEIAKRIADVLQVKLLRDETVMVESKPTENMDAYTLYLKATQKLADRTKPAMMEAIDLYERAIEEDPRFSRAYAGLATTYHILWDHGHLSSGEALPKVSEYSMRALELDPNSAEAHTCLAAVLEQSYDSPAAEREFRFAISLNPNYATAHHWYALCLISLQRPLEAIEELKKALVADPLSPMIGAVLGSAYFSAGMLEEAWKQLEDTLKLEPGFWIPYFFRALWLIKLSRLDEAERELSRGLIFSPGHPELTSTLAYVHARKGKTADAKKVLGALLKTRREDRTGDFVSAKFIAIAYAGLHDTERSLEYLEVSVKEKTINTYSLLYYPQFDDFRADPRFKEILRQANIEPA
ncbi:MAG: tetratricopeptide repeat protein, partial [Thaumarchaeota archaeon]|nr:tetratricopeptide repeat protein [Nitrososphaerota archaeon]